MVVVVSAKDDDDTGVVAVPLILVDRSVAAGEDNNKFRKTSLFVEGTKSTVGYGYGLLFFLPKERNFWRLVDAMVIFQ